MMNRRSWLKWVPAALLPAAATAQSVNYHLKNPPERHGGSKFYITGFHHSATANDCTIPPIIAYGGDRMDALLNCCEGGGLSVWTESEWMEFQRHGGKELREYCDAVNNAAKKGTTK